ITCSAPRERGEHHESQEGRPEGRDGERHQGVRRGSRSVEAHARAVHRVHGRADRRPGDPPGGGRRGSKGSEGTPMNEGLQVIMTSAFYRDGEPGGIAAGMKFAPEEGVKFCNELEESLLEYDKFTFVQLQSELARLAPRRHDLRPSEACHVIACIYCMQVRNDIRSD